MSKIYIDKNDKLRLQQMIDYTAFSYKEIDIELH
jgi:hypothetical protein